MKKTLSFIFVCLLVSLTSQAEASASIDSLYNIYLEANGNQNPKNSAMLSDCYSTVDCAFCMMGDFKVLYDTQQKENEIQLFKLKERCNRNVIMISVIFMALCLNMKLESLVSGSGLDVCMDIMDICCDGLRSREIAQKLNISIRTVETHKNNILKAMNINSTTEMVKSALEKHIMQI